MHIFLFLSCLFVLSACGGGGDTSNSSPATGNSSGSEGGATANSNQPVASGNASNGQSAVNKTPVKTLLADGSTKYNTGLTLSADRTTLKGPHGFEISGGEKSMLGGALDLVFVYVEAGDNGNNVYNGYVEQYFLFDSNTGELVFSDNNLGTIQNPRQTKLLAHAPNSEGLVYSNPTIQSISLAGDVYYKDGTVTTGATFAPNLTATLPNGDTLLLNGQFARTNVPANKQGRWIRMYNGSSLELGAKTALSYVVIDEYTLEVVAGATSVNPGAGSKYYLVKAGVDNVVVTGSIANQGVASSIYSLRMRHILSGRETIANITGQGKFSSVMASGRYMFQIASQKGRALAKKVNVRRDRVDFGEFTLTNKKTHNFKVSVDTTNRDELIYFAGVLYQKNLKIENISGVDASGLSFQVTSADPYVQLLSPTVPIAGIAAGGSLNIPFDIKFTKPTSDRDVRLDIKITDINQLTWNDYAVMRLSSQGYAIVWLRHPAQTTGGANGYLVGQGRTLLRFRTTDIANPSDFGVGNLIAGGIRVNDFHSGYLLVPNTVGSKYEIVLSNISISSETAYSITVGSAAVSSLPPANSFVGFAATSINEPADNTVSGATVLTSNMTHVGYVSVGDIDHFIIKF